MGLNDFKLGTFIGRFPSDGEASIAVKGLNPNLSGVALHSCRYCDSVIGAQLIL